MTATARRTMTLADARAVYAFAAYQTIGQPMPVRASSKIPAFATKLDMRKKHTAVHGPLMSDAMARELADAYRAAHAPYVGCVGVDWNTGTAYETMSWERMMSE